MQQQCQETQQQRQETQFGNRVQKLDASPQECVELVGLVGSLGWALVMALEKEKGKAAMAARWGAIFVVQKPHPLPHCRTDLLLPQCPHQVANNKGVMGTPTTVVLMPVSQPVTQQVFSRAKVESLVQETKLAMYAAQSTVFA